MAASKSIDECLLDGDKVQFIVNTTKRTSRSRALCFISIWYNNGWYRMLSNIRDTFFGSQLSEHDLGWDVSFDESNGTMIDRMTSLAAQISSEFKYTTPQGEVRNINAVYEGELYIPVLMETKLLPSISISLGEIM